MKFLNKILGAVAIAGTIYGCAALKTSTPLEYTVERSDNGFSVSGKFSSPEIPDAKVELYHEEWDYVACVDGKGNEIEGDYTCPLKETRRHCKDSFYFYSGNDLEMIIHDDGCEAPLERIQYEARDISGIKGAACYSDEPYKCTKAQMKEAKHLVKEAKKVLKYKENVAKQKEHGTILGGLNKLQELFK